MLAFVQCMPARPGLPHSDLDAPEVTGYINDDAGVFSEHVYHEFSES